VIDRDGEGVVLIGDPGELILYAFGARIRPQVQLECPDDAVATFRDLSLGV
jgi:hypothetical protein